MLLFLVRHAHAVAGEQDAARPLSPRGIEDTRKLAAFFQQNGVFAPVQLWHSPLRRARETAELLVRELKLEGVLMETVGLQPEDDPAEIAERVSKFSGTDSVAIVGHEPHLSALATMLIRGKSLPVAFELKKGGVIALERIDEVHKKTGLPRWVVRWQISPRLLGPRSETPSS